MEDFEASEKEAELAKAIRGLQVLEKEREDVVLGFIREKEITEKVHQEELQELRTCYDEEFVALREEFMNEKENLLSETHSQQVEYDTLETERARENERKIMNKSEEGIKKSEERLRNEKRKLREEYESVIAHKTTEIEELFRENCILRSKSDPHSFEDRNKDVEIVVNKLKGEISSSKENYAIETQKLKDEFEFERSELERKHVREKAEFVKNLTVKFDKQHEDNELEKNKSYLKNQNETKEKIEIVEQLWEDRNMEERKKMNTRFENEIAQLKMRFAEDLTEKLSERDTAIDNLENEKEYLLNSIHVERFELAKYYNRELSLLNRLDSPTKEDIEVALIDEVAKLRDEQQKVIRNMEKRHKRKLKDLTEKQKPLVEILEQHTNDIEDLKSHYEREREEFEAQLRNDQLNLLKSFEFEKGDIERYYKQVIEDRENEFKEEIEQIQKDHEKEVEKMGHLEKENQEFKKELSHEKERNEELFDKLQECESQNARLKEEIEKESRSKREKVETPEDGQQSKELKNPVEELSNSNILLADQLEKEQKKCEELLERIHELEKLHQDALRKNKEEEVQQTATSEVEQEKEQSNNSDSEEAHGTTTLKNKKDGVSGSKEMRSLDEEMELQEYLLELKALQGAIDAKDTEMTQMKEEYEKENNRLKESMQDLKGAIKSTLEGDGSEDDNLEVFKSRQKNIKDLLNQEEKESESKGYPSGKRQSMGSEEDDTKIRGFADEVNTLDDLITEDVDEKESGIQVKEKINKKLKAIKANIVRSHDLEKLENQLKHEEEKNKYLKELTDEKEAEMAVSEKVWKAVCEKLGIEEEKSEEKLTELLETKQPKQEKIAQESAENKEKDETCVDAEKLEKLENEKEELERTIVELEKHFNKEKKKLLKKMQTQHKEFVLSPEAEVIEALTKEKAVLEEASNIERFNLGRIYYMEMQDELEDLLSERIDDIQKDLENEKMEIIFKFNKDIADLHKTIAEKDENEVELLKDKNAMARKMLSLQRRTAEDDEKLGDSEIDEIKTEADKLEAIIPLKKEIAQLQRKRQEEHESNADNLGQAVEVIKELLAERHKEDGRTKRRYSFVSNGSQYDSGAEDQQSGRTSKSSHPGKISPMIQDEKRHIDRDTEQTPKDTTSGQTSPTSTPRQPMSQEEINSKEDLLKALECLIDNTFTEEKNYESETSSGAISDFDSVPSSPNPESEDGTTDSGAESIENDCLSIKKSDLDLAMHLERFGLGRLYYNEYKDSLQDVLKKLVKAEGKNQCLENKLSEGIKDLVNRTSFVKRSVLSVEVETQTTADGKEADVTAAEDKKAIPGLTDDDTAQGSTIEQSETANVDELKESKTDAEKLSKESDDKERDKPSVDGSKDDGISVDTKESVRKDKDTKHTDDENVNASDDPSLIMPKESKEKDTTNATTQTDEEEQEIGRDMESKEIQTTDDLLADLIESQKDQIMKDDKLPATREKDQGDESEVPESRKPKTDKDKSNIIDELVGAPESSRMLIEMPGDEQVTDESKIENEGEETTDKEKASTPNDEDKARKDELPEHEDEQDSENAVQPTSEKEKERGKDDEKRENIPMSDEMETKKSPSHVPLEDERPTKDDVEKYDMIKDDPDEESLAQEYKNLKDKYNMLKALVGKWFVEEIPELKTKDHEEAEKEGSEDLDENQLRELREEDKSIMDEIAAINKQMSILKNMSDSNVREEEKKLNDQELDVLKQLEKIMDTLKKEEDQYLTEHLANEKVEIEKQLEEIERDMEERIDAISSDEKNLFDVMKKKCDLEEQIAQKAQDLDKNHKKLAQLKQEAEEEQTLDKDIDDLKEQHVVLQGLLDSQYSKSSPHESREKEIKDSLKIKEEDQVAQPVLAGTLDPNIENLIKEKNDKDRDATKAAKKMKQAERDRDRNNRMAKDRAERLKPFLKKRQRLQDVLGKDDEEDVMTSLSAEDTLPSRDRERQMKEDGIQEKGKLPTGHEDKDNKIDEELIDASRGSGDYSSSKSPEIDSDKLIMEQDAIKEKLHGMEDQIHLLFDKAIQRNYDPPTESLASHVQTLKGEEADINAQITEQQAALESTLGADVNAEELSEILESKANQVMELSDILSILPDGFDKLPEDAQQAFELACLKDELEREIAKIDHDIDQEETCFNDAVKYEREGVLDESDSNVNESVEKKDKLLKELKTISQQIAEALDKDEQSEAEQIELDSNTQRKREIEQLLEEVQDEIEQEPVRAAENLSELIKSKHQKEQDMANTIDSLKEMKEKLDLSDVSDPICSAISLMDDDLKDCDKVKVRELEKEIQEAAAAIISLNQQQKNPEREEDKLVQLIEQHKSLPNETPLADNNVFPPKSVFAQLHKAADDLETTETKLNGIYDGCNQDEISQIEQLDALMKAKHNLGKEAELFEELDDLLGERKGLEKTLEECKAKQELMDIEKIIHQKEEEIERLEGNVEEIDAILVDLMNVVNNNNADESELENTIKEALEETQKRLEEAEKEKEKHDEIQNQKELKIKEDVSNLEDELEESREELEFVESELHLDSEHEDPISPELLKLTVLLNSKKSLTDYLFEINSQLDNCDDTSKEPLSQDAIDDLRACKHDAEDKLAGIQQEKSKFEIEIQDEEIQEMFNALCEEKKELEDQRKTLMGKIHGANIFSRMVDELEDKEPSEDEKKYYTHALNEMIAEQKTLIQLAEENDKLKEVACNQRALIEDMNNRLTASLGDQLAKVITSSPSGDEKQTAILGDQPTKAITTSPSDDDKQTAILGDQPTKATTSSPSDDDKQTELLGDQPTKATTSSPSDDDKQIELLGDRSAKTITSSSSDDEKQSDIPQSVIDRMTNQDETIAAILQDLSEENKNLRDLNDEVSKDLDCLKEKIGEKLADCLLDPTEETNKATLGPIYDVIEADGTIQEILEDYNNDLERIEDLLGKNLTNCLLNPDELSRTTDDLTDIPKAPKIMKDKDEDLETVLAAYEDKLEHLGKENDVFKNMLGNDLVKALLQLGHGKEHELQFGLDKSGIPTTDAKYDGEYPLAAKRRDFGLDGEQDGITVPTSDQTLEQQMKAAKPSFTAKTTPKGKATGIKDKMKMSKEKTGKSDDDTDDVRPAYTQKFENEIKQGEPSLTSMTKPKGKATGLEDKAKLRKERPTKIDGGRGDIFAGATDAPKLEQEMEVGRPHFATKTEPKGKAKSKDDMAKMRNAKGSKVDDDRDEGRAPALAGPEILTAPLQTEPDVNDNELFALCSIEAPLRMAEKNKTLGEIIKGYENDLDTLESRLGPRLYDSILDAGKPDVFGEEEASVTGPEQDISRQKGKPVSKLGKEISKDTYDKIHGDEKAEKTQYDSDVTKEEKEREDDASSKRGKVERGVDKAQQAKKRVTTETPKHGVPKRGRVDISTETPSADKEQPLQAGITGRSDIEGVEKAHEKRYPSKPTDFDRPASNLKEDEDEFLASPRRKMIDENMTLEDVINGYEGKQSTDSDRSEKPSTLADAADIKYEDDMEARHKGPAEKTDIAFVKSQQARKTEGQQARGGRDSDDEFKRLGKTIDDGAPVRDLEAKGEAQKGAKVLKPTRKTEKQQTRGTDAEDDDVMQHDDMEEERDEYHSDESITDSVPRSDEMLAPLQMQEQNQTLEEVVKGYENDLKTLNSKLGPELFKSVLDAGKSDVATMKPETLTKRIGDPYGSEEISSDEKQLDPELLESVLAAGKSEVDTKKPKTLPKRKGDLDGYEDISVDDKQFQKKDAHDRLSPKHVEAKKRQLDETLGRRAKQASGIPDQRKQMEQPHLTAVDDDHVRDSQEGTETDELRKEDELKTGTSFDSIQQTLQPQPQLKAPRFLREPDKTLQEIIQKYENDLDTFNSKLGPNLARAVLNSGRKRDGEETDVLPEEERYGFSPDTDKSDKEKIEKEYKQTGSVSGDENVGANDKQVSKERSQEKEHEMDERQEALKGAKIRDESDTIKVSDKEPTIEGLERQDGILPVPARQESEALQTILSPLLSGDNDNTIEDIIQSLCDKLGPNLTKSLLSMDSEPSTDLSEFSPEIEREEVYSEGSGSEETSDLKDKQAKAAKKQKLRVDDKQKPERGLQERRDKEKTKSSGKGSLDTDDEDLRKRRGADEDERKQTSEDEVTEPSLEVSAGDKQLPQDTTPTKTMLAPEIMKEKNSSLEDVIQNYENELSTLKNALGPNLVNILLSKDKENEGVGDDTLCKPDSSDAQEDDISYLQGPAQKGEITDRGDRRKQPIVTGSSADSMPKKVKKKAKDFKQKHFEEEDEDGEEEDRIKHDKRKGKNRASKMKEKTKDSELKEKHTDDDDDGDDDDESLKLQDGIISVPSRQQSEALQTILSPLLSGDNDSTIENIMQSLCDKLGPNLTKSLINMEREEVYSEGSGSEETSDLKHKQAKAAKKQKLRVDDKQKPERGLQERRDKEKTKSSGKGSLDTDDEDLHKRRGADEDKRKQTTEDDVTEPSLEVSADDKQQPQDTTPTKTMLAPEIMKEKNSSLEDVIQNYENELSTLKNALGPNLVNILLEKEKENKGVEEDILRTTDSSGEQEADILDLQGSAQKGEITDRVDRRKQPIGTGSSADSMPKKVKKKAKDFKQKHFVEEHEDDEEEDRIKHDQRKGKNRASKMKEKTKESELKERHTDDDDDGDDDDESLKLQDGSISVPSRQQSEALQTILSPLLSGDNDSTIEDIMQSLCDKLGPNLTKSLINMDSEPSTALSDSILEVERVEVSTEGSGSESEETSDLKDKQAKAAKKQKLRVDDKQKPKTRLQERRDKDKTTSSGKGSLDTDDEDLHKRRGADEDKRKQTTKDEVIESSLEDTADSKQQPQDTTPTKTMLAPEIMKEKNSSLEDVIQNYENDLSTLKNALGPNLVNILLEKDKENKGVEDDILRTTDSTDEQEADISDLQGPAQKGEKTDRVERRKQPIDTGSSADSMPKKVNKKAKDFKQKNKHFEEEDEDDEKEDRIKHDKRKGKKRTSKMKEKTKESELKQRHTDDDDDDGDDDDESLKLQDSSISVPSRQQSEALQTILSPLLSGDNDSTIEDIMQSLCDKLGPNLTKSLINMDSEPSTALSDSILEVDRVEVSTEGSGSESEETSDLKNKQAKAAKNQRVRVDDKQKPERRLQERRDKEKTIASGKVTLDTDDEVLQKGRGADEHKRKPTKDEVTEPSLEDTADDKQQPQDTTPAKTMLAPEIMKEKNSSLEDVIQNYENDLSTLKNALGPNLVNILLSKEKENESDEDDVLRTPDSSDEQEADISDLQGPAQKDEITDRVERRKQPIGTGSSADSMPKKVKIKAKDLKQKQTHFEEEDEDDEEEDRIKHDQRKGKKRASKMKEKTKDSELKERHTDDDGDDDDQSLKLQDSSISVPSRQQSEALQTILSPLLSGDYNDSTIEDIMQSLCDKLGHNLTKSLINMDSEPTTELSVSILEEEREEVYSEGSGSESEDTSDLKHKQAKAAKKQKVRVDDKQKPERRLQERRDKEKMIASGKDTLDTDDEDRHKRRGADEHKRKQTKDEVIESSLEDTADGKQQPQDTTPTKTMLAPEIMKEKNSSLEDVIQNYENDLSTLKNALGPNLVNILLSKEKENEGDKDDTLRTPDSSDEQEADILDLQGPAQKGEITDRVERRKQPIDTGSSADLKPVMRKKKTKDFKQKQKHLEEDQEEDNEEEEEDHIKHDKRKGKKRASKMKEKIKDSELKERHTDDDGDDDHDHDESLKRPDGSISVPSRQQSEALQTILSPLLSGDNDSTIEDIMQSLCDDLKTLKDKLGPNLTKSLLSMDSEPSTALSDTSREAREMKTDDVGSESDGEEISELKDRKSDAAKKLKASVDDKQKPERRLQERRVKDKTTASGKGSLDTDDEDEWAREQRELKSGDTKGEDKGDEPMDLEALSRMSEKDETLEEIIKKYEDTLNKYESALGPQLSKAILTDHTSPGVISASEQKDQSEDKDAKVIGPEKDDSKRHIPTTKSDTPKTCVTQR
ncbi:hypothetical protein QZH41_002834 [Actinostola sp. cb2023]|nr:hypothetical protein QZH41_002834 [Actinostola sp. cb2023]